MAARGLGPSGCCRSPAGRTRSDQGRRHRHVHPPPRRPGAGRRAEAAEGSAPVVGRRSPSRAAALKGRPGRGLPWDRVGSVGLHQPGERALGRCHSARAPGARDRRRDYRGRGETRWPTWPSGLRVARDEVRSMGHLCPEALSVGSDHAPGTGRAGRRRLGLRHVRRPSRPSSVTAPPGRPRPRSGLPSTSGRCGRTPRPPRAGRRAARRGAGGRGVRASSGQR